MDVETVDEQYLSLRRVAVYVAVTGAFLVAVLAPVALSKTYLRLLKTAVLLVLLVQLARILVSAAASFADPETPPVPPEGDLPTASVVIPAYNEAPVLADTLDACLALDYPAEKLEVVVCYEADCDDDTGAIAREYAADHEAVVAVERDEPGGGKAKAANYAIRHATGEVIASIDADHRFESDALRKAVAWFHADESVAVVKGRCFGRNPGDSVVALHATVDRHVVEKAEIFARQVFRGFTIFGGGQAFFRREVLDAFGGFDEEVMVEDIDLSARLHVAGERIRVDPSIITYEEQPATVRAWWAQRKRWVRGWMQVSVRHFRGLLTSPCPNPMAKVDAAQSFTFSVIPPFLVVGLAFPLLDMTSMGATAYVPYSRVIWTLMGAMPALAALLVFAQDRRDGLAHAPREYLAALTLGPYMLVVTFVYVVAFIEEFVLRAPSKYVTTARAPEE